MDPERAASLPQAKRAVGQSAQSVGRIRCPPSPSRRWNVTSLVSLYSLSLSEMVRARAAICPRVYWLQTADADARRLPLLSLPLLDPQPVLRGGEVGVDARAEVAQRVAAELLEQRLGQDDGDHRLADDRRRGDGADV